jgi:hypothetical protein
MELILSPFEFGKIELVIESNENQIQKTIFVPKEEQPIVATPSQTIQENQTTQTKNLLQKIIEALMHLLAGLGIIEAQ